MSSSSSDSNAGFVCSSPEWTHSACAGPSLTNEFDSRRYCLLHYPGQKNSAQFMKFFQSKLEAGQFDFSGVWFPDAVKVDTKFSSKANFRGAIFNGVANFSRATFETEADFNLTSFEEDTSFYNAVFGGPCFFGQTVFRKRANFRAARFAHLANFNTAVFKAEADFTNTLFRKAAIFDGARFHGRAEFKETTFDARAHLSSVTFRSPVRFNYSSFGNRTNFISTTFRKTVEFRGAMFASEVDFSSVTFGDQVIFRGSEDRVVFSTRSALNMQYGKIEKPELILFDTVSLRPHWFVNVDARKFEFANVKWDGQDVERELNLLRARDASAPYSFLAIAYGRLAVNSEENLRYDQASMFRYRAMETRRLEGVEGRRKKSSALRWRVARKLVSRLYRAHVRDWGVCGRVVKRLRRSARLCWTDQDLLHRFYRFVSGYGERIGRAFIVLVGIWLLSAGVYTFAEFSPVSESLVTGRKSEPPQPLTVGRALSYSAAIMTLQRPEPRPATTTAHAVVVLESILGPVQAALLALAIRRKFMR